MSKIIYSDANLKCLTSQISISFGKHYVQDGKFLALGILQRTNKQCSEQFIGLDVNLVLWSKKHGNLFFNLQQNVSVEFALIYPVCNIMMQEPKYFASLNVLTGCALNINSFNVLVLLAISFLRHLSTACSAHYFSFAVHSLLSNFSSFFKLKDIWICRQKDLLYNIQIRTIRRCAFCENWCYRFIGEA